MKTFLALHSYKNFTYGQKVIQKIYRIKNNKFKYLGTNTFNTGSMMGESHECAAWLMRNKYIPKTWVTKGTPYINYDIYDTYNEGKGKYYIKELSI